MAAEGAEGGGGAVVGVLPHPFPLVASSSPTFPNTAIGSANAIAVSAVRSRGGTAWHLLAQNEGHGFHKKENEDYYFWTSLLFWKQTLLGEAAR